MNIKALLEKRGALVRELEAFQKIETPTDEQRAKAAADMTALDAVKVEIEQADAPT